MNEKWRERWDETVRFLKSVLWYFPMLWKTARDERLNPFWLIYENTVLYLRYRVDSRMYFIYRLFDRHISWADKQTYLPSDESPGVKTLLGVHTPPRIARFFRDKLSFNYMFNTLNLPLAHVHAVYNGDTGYLEHAVALKDVAALDRWMRTTEVVDLAYKPIRGINGRLVLIFVGRAPDDPGIFVTLTGERYDAKKLAEFSANETFLFEGRIRQHPALTELLGETLCCVRVVTMITLENKPRILGAVFKLTAESVGVDHLRYGAVGSWVDPETGELNIGRTRFSLKPTWRIPGSHRSFQGFRLPCWEEVKALALRAAAGMPLARSVGWDIAISDHGPVLIEGNDDWSVELLQMPAPYGLVRGEFKALCDTLMARRREEKAKEAAHRRQAARQASTSGRAPKR